MQRTQGGDDSMQVVAHNMLAQFTSRQLNITSKDKEKSQRSYHQDTGLTGVQMMLQGLVFRKKCAGRFEDWEKQ